MIPIFLNKMNAFINSELDSNILQKVKCEPYVRELNRYGHSTINTIEDIFCINSEFTMNLLFEDSSLNKFVLATYHIDSIYKSFNLDLDSRMKLVNISLESFTKEFGLPLDKNHRKLLYKEYLEVKDLFKSFFIHNKNNYEKESLLLDRHKTLLIERLRVLNKQDQKNVLECIDSIIHMSLNRFFVSQQRYNELKVYYFLNKFYQMVKNNPNIEIEKL